MITKQIEIKLPDGKTKLVSVKLKKWYSFCFAKDFNEKNKKGKQVVHNLDPRKETKLTFDVEPIPTTYFNLDNVKESWHIERTMRDELLRKVLEFIESCSWEETDG